MKNARAVITQTRMPQDLHDYVRDNAERLGVSQNAFMMILMDLGRKVYESNIITRQKIIHIT
jgi:hypothetical protein